MSSYLIYCITCVSNIIFLPHEPWSEDVTIYQYCPLLQKDKVLEEFRKTHDVLIESVYLNLRKVSMLRISPEAQKLIQMYGSYFIQFITFTYLQIG